MRSRFSIPPLEGDKGEDNFSLFRSFVLLFQTMDRMLNLSNNLSQIIYDITFRKTQKCVSKVL